MQDILKYLFELAEQRIDDIVVDIELNNHEYKSIRKKSTEVEQEILKKHEMQNNFLEYEELNSKRELLIRREIYKNGFLDGIKVAKFIKSYC